jgi:quercetin dioxygenase-like cupin family protein
LAVCFGNVFPKQKIMFLMRNEVELVKRLSDYVGAQPDKFHKATLFSSVALLLGVNCLEPGQAQQPHAHAGQDKFYYVVEGSGRFWIGEERVTALAGEVIWAPAGVNHGVENEAESRLTLLVGIAPAP